MPKNDNCIILPRKYIYHYSITIGHCQVLFCWQAYLLKQLLSLVQNPASPYKLQIMYILLMTLCGACYSQLFASAFAISSLAGTVNSFSCTVNASRNYNYVLYHSLESRTMYYFICLCCFIFFFYSNNLAVLCHSAVWVYS